MKKTFLFCLFLSAIRLADAQPIIVDTCFTSADIGTTFPTTGDLFSLNADLVEWDGTGWAGFWPDFPLTIKPFSSTGNCRAIFIGDGQAWTTGGEGIGFRLSEPLVAGQDYVFSFTYASHGPYSDGTFAPNVYSLSDTFFNNQTAIATLPTAGADWLTSEVAFTAEPSQDGDSWLLVHNGPDGKSGLISSYCTGCSPVSGTQDSVDGIAEITVSPNPFAGELNIVAKNLGPVVLTMTDVCSREVFRETFTGSATVQTESLANGAYFYKLTDRSGTIKIGRLVKQ